MKKGVKKVKTDPTQLWIRFGNMTLKTPEVLHVLGKFGNLLGIGRFGNLTSLAFFVQPY